MQEVCGVWWAAFRASVVTVRFSEMVRIGSATVMATVAELRRTGNPWVRGCSDVKTTGLISCGHDPVFGYLPPVHCEAAIKVHSRTFFETNRAPPRRAGAARSTIQTRSHCRTHGIRFTHSLFTTTPEQIRSRSGTAHSPALSERGSQKASTKLGGSG